MIIPDYMLLTQEGDSDSTLRDFLKSHKYGNYRGYKPYSGLEGYAFDHKRGVKISWSMQSATNPNVPLPKNGGWNCFQIYRSFHWVGVSLRTVTAKYKSYKGVSERIETTEYKLSSYVYIKSGDSWSCMGRTFLNTDEVFKDAVARANTMNGAEPIAKVKSGLMQNVVMENVCKSLSVAEGSRFNFSVEKAELSAQPALLVVTPKFDSDLKHPLLSRGVFIGLKDGALTVSRSNNEYETTRSSALPCFADPAFDPSKIIEFVLSLLDDLETSLANLKRIERDMIDEVNVRFDACTSKLERFSW